MANRDSQLPNLKICIDNTESEKDLDDVVLISDQPHSPGEFDDDRNVEFNVRIGKLGQTIKENSRFRPVSLKLFN